MRNHKILKRLVRRMERLSLKETDRGLGAISRPSSAESWVQARTSVLLVPGFTSMLRPSALVSQVHQGPNSREYEDDSQSEKDALVGATRKYHRV